MPGAASTLSAVIVEPSSRVATNVPFLVSSVTIRWSGARCLRSANQSVWSRKTPMGIGSTSAGDSPACSKYASNESWPAASSDQSGPDLRNMPSGIWSRQNAIGRPSTWVSMPRSCAYAAAE